MPNTHIWRIITGDRAPCEQVTSLEYPVSRTEERRAELRSALAKLNEEKTTMCENPNCATPYCQGCFGGEKVEDSADYYENEDDGMDYDDYGDAPEDEPTEEPEQEPAPVTLSRLTPLFIATVVLFVLVCIVQTCLEVRCNHEGPNFIYCTLTN